MKNQKSPKTVETVDTITTTTTDTTTDTTKFFDTKFDGSKIVDVNYRAVLSISQKEEREKLKGSIKQFGLQSPITLIKELGSSNYLIVGGYNRLIICEELGIDPLFSVLTGASTVSGLGILQMENNLSIKDTKKERNAVITKLATAGKSVEQIARVTGLSQEQVRFYVKIDTVALSQVEEKTGLSIDDLSQNIIKKLDTKILTSLQDGDYEYIKSVVIRDGEKKGAAALKTLLSDISSKNKKSTLEESKNKKKTVTTNEYAFLATAKEVHSWTQIVEDTKDYEGFFSMIKKAILVK